MRRKIGHLIIGFIACALILGGITGAAAAKDEIVVGNKNFTEQYVVGQMIKQLLEDRGYDVEMKSDLTSMALRSGLEAGDIEICAEYTGTAWMTHLKKEYKAGMGHNDIYKKVKKADTKNDIVWLNPIWNHNTYALACWPEYAEKHDLKTLSDLAEFCNEKDGKISMFVDFEFSTRPDGMPALEDHYGFDVKESSLKTGAPGASVMGLANHQANVAMVFGTDAAIADHGWAVLEDDKSFFPPYDLAPCVRKETLDKHPEIEKILISLIKTFPGGGEKATSFAVTKTRDVWRSLNAKVDIEQMEPREVAHRLLDADVPLQFKNRNSSAGIAVKRCSPLLKKIAILSIIGC